MILAERVFISEESSRKARKGREGEKAENTIAVQSPHFTIP